MNKSNSTAHIDKLVFYLFSIVFLIASTAWAFRYASLAPCNEALFEHTANDYNAGELIKFYDMTEGAIEWEWDFGDGSEKSRKKNPLHIYSKEGKYEVRLLVNGNCAKNEAIDVLPKLVMVDSTKFPKFELPESVVVGQPLIVEDQTEGATAWEWRFGETAEANAKTKIAKYVYNAPGLKTVSLVVNDSLAYITNKKINVLPLAETEEKIQQIKPKRRDKRLDLRSAPDEGSRVIDAKPNSNKPQVVPFITKSNFQNKMKLIASNKLSASALSDFFCDDPNPLIEANGRNVTFFAFCEKIKDEKVNIKSLKLQRKTGSNCISTLMVEYQN